MSEALTLVPMAPHVAKLWHQLQATMLKDTHGLDVTPVGAAVLPTVRPDVWDFESSVGGSSLTVGKSGHSDQYLRRFKCPESWHLSWWNPAHWHCYHSRTDAEGRNWSAVGGVFVMDDFGFLVEVPK